MTKRVTFGQARGAYSDAAPLIAVQEKSDRVQRAVAAAASKAFRATLKSEIRKLAKVEASRT